MSSSQPIDVSFRESSASPSHESSVSLSQKLSPPPFLKSKQKSKHQETPPRPPPVAQRPHIQLSPPLHPHRASSPSPSAIDLSSSDDHGGNAKPSTWPSDFYYIDVVDGFVKRDCAHQEGWSTSEVFTGLFNMPFHSSAANGKVHLRRYTIAALQLAEHLVENGLFYCPAKGCTSSPSLASFWFFFSLSFSTFLSLFVFPHIFIIAM
jgi:hypothetical protein